MQDAAFPEQPAASARRAQAFREASRHSGRVQFLRRFIVAGAFAIVSAMVAITVFDPFRSLAKGASVGKIGLDGSRVTMDSPKMSGFQKDGRAYSLTAATGVQDLKKPTLIELTEIEARIGMADKSNAQISAPKGLYDTTAETMEMSGDVKVRSDSGYDLRMTQVHMEFKTNHMTSSEPVNLTMKSGTVKADTMEVLDTGHHIVFEGHVESVMLPAAEARETAKSLKGTNP